MYCGVVFVIFNLEITNSKRCAYYHGRTNSFAIRYVKVDANGRGGSRRYRMFGKLHADESTTMRVEL